AGGFDSLSDQRVYDRVADTGQVQAAIYIGGLAAPVAPELHPGGQAQAVAGGDDVEVEGLEPALVLGRVDAADAGGDAQALEVGDVIAEHTLRHRIDDDELDLERFALGVDAGAVFDCPTGLVQQLVGGLQQLAVLAGAVRHRRLVRRLEDLRR